MKKLHQILSFCFAILPFLLTGQQLGSRTQDSLALVEFYHQTNGDYWTNNKHWLTEKPLEQWHGITTKIVRNAGGSRVSKINLPNNALSGTLGLYLDDLYYLDELLIPNNKINALEDIFQTAPWSSQVNYYLPDYVDINNNALHYPDLEDNACWLAIIGNYANQYVETEPLFRYIGWDDINHIPFLGYEEEPMEYVSEYPSVTFQWFLDNEIEAGATERTYSPAPYSVDDIGIDYRRCAYFPAVPISHCGLEAVNIYASFDLTIYHWNSGDLGAYQLNQFIIKYDPDIDAQTLADNEDFLINTYNASLVKECPCGPIIQLWETDLGVASLETVRCGAESQSRVDTTELNFLFSYNKYRDIIEINSIPDSSYLDILPENVNQSNLIVGIDDSGVDPTNSLLNPFLWINPEVNDDDNCVLGDNNGYDFRNDIGLLEDSNNHGTAVNGIIARGHGKETGAQLMNTRFYEGRYGELFDAVCGMHYSMDNGVNILNLSWGYYTDSVSTILRDAIERAEDEEVLIVTSAGNEGTNNSFNLKWPANFTNDFTNMIVVSSYHILNDNSFLFPDYANFSSQLVHLAAPGHARSTNNEGGLSEDYQGTSISTPYVSRAAASLMMEFPTLSITQVKDCILNTVITRPELTNRVSSGGYLNFSKARTHAEGIANSLPLELIHFSAKKTKSQTCKLEWQVQNERQLDYYEIMKSNNSKDWESIAIIFPDNSNRGLKDYALEDKKLSPGISYYQLKQIDNDGSTSLSNIISIQSQITEQESFIYPNPITNHQFFLPELATDLFNKIEITNAQGQVVYQQILTDRSNRITLPNEFSGIYLVNLKGEVQQITQKIYIK